MILSSKLLRGNRCAQVFTNYPLKGEADAVDALNEVIHSVGDPKERVSNGAMAEVKDKFTAVANEYCVKQKTTEPYSGWQNRAEAAIREIKRGIKRASIKTRSPSVSGIIVDSGLPPSGNSLRTISRHYMTEFQARLLKDKHLIYPSMLNLGGIRLFGSLIQQFSSRMMPGRLEGG